MNVPAPTAASTAPQAHPGHPDRPLRLHRHRISGHAHRVELLLSLRALRYELVDVDLLAGAHKTPDFLKVNPFGQGPVLEDGEQMLADSSAILVYLALRYDRARSYYPEDPARAAEVMRFLPVAQDPLAYGPAASRVSALFQRDYDLEKAKSEGAKLLDAHLEARAAGVSDRDRVFFVGDAPTLADVALYAYVAHAPEGGVPLTPHSHLLAWTARMQALPRFVSLVSTQTKVYAA